MASALDSWCGPPRPGTMEPAGYIKPPYITGVKTQEEPGKSKQRQPGGKALRTNTDKHREW